MNQQPVVSKMDALLISTANHQSNHDGYQQLLLTMECKIEEEKTIEWLLLLPSTTHDHLNKHRPSTSRCATVLLHWNKEPAARDVAAASATIAPFFWPQCLWRHHEPPVCDVVVFHPLAIWYQQDITAPAGTHIVWKWEKEETRDARSSMTTLFL